MNRVEGVTIAKNLLQLLDVTDHVRYETTKTWLPGFTVKFPSLVLFSLSHNSEGKILCNYLYLTFNHRAESRIRSCVWIFIYFVHKWVSSLVVTKTQTSDRSKFKKADVSSVSPSLDRIEELCGVVVYMRVFLPLVEIWLDEFVNKLVEWEAFINSVWIDCTQLKNEFSFEKSIYPPNLNLFQVISNALTGKLRPQKMRPHQIQL